MNKEAKKQTITELLEGALYALDSYQTHQSDDDLKVAEEAIKEVQKRSKELIDGVDKFVGVGFYKKHE